MTTSQRNRPLFLPGQVVATPGFLHAIAATGESPVSFLRRHLSGDWGEVCEEDRQANDQALASEARLLSAYCLSDGTRFWIITEADRSATTFLLPSEY